MTQAHAQEKVVPIERAKRPASQPARFDPELAHAELMKPDNAKLLDVLTVDHGFERVILKQRRVGVWAASDGTQLFSIPIYSGSELTGVVYRDAELKFRRMSGKQPCLYGEAALREITDGEVVLTSNELDVLAAASLQLDPPVVAIPSGVSGLLTDEWVKALSRLDRVYLAFPPDKKSQERLRKIAAQLGDMRSRIVKLSHGMKSIHQAHSTGLSDDNLSKTIRSARPVDSVLDAIEAIDKSDAFVTSQLVEKVVPLIAGADAAKREDYIAAIRVRFGLRAQALKVLRREIESLLETDEVDEQPGPEYQMSDDERAEAMELLKDPNLLDRIERDLTEACGIVGESHLKVGLLLIMMSPRLSAKNPISATVFGASSEGKSYLINQVASVLDPAWVCKVSIFSSRALESAGEDLLDHKVIIVGELEGLGDDDALLSMIRQAQTENRLSRMVAQYDKDNGGPRVTVVALHAQ